MFILDNWRLCVNQKQFVIVFIQQFMTFNTVLKYSNK